jgi:hypothetical protein
VTKAGVLEKQLARFFKKFAGGSRCRKKDLVILKRGLRG